MHLDFALGFATFGFALIKLSAFAFAFEFLGCRGGKCYMIRMKVSHANNVAVVLASSKV